MEGEAPDGKALVEEMGATKGAIVPPVCGRRKGHAGLEDTGVDIFRYLVFLCSVVVCCCFLSQVSKTIPFSPLSANIFYYSPPPPTPFCSCLCAGNSRVRWKSRPREELLKRTGLVESVPWRRGERTFDSDRTGESEAPTRQASRRRQTSEANSLYVVWRRVLLCRETVSEGRVLMIS